MLDKIESWVTIYLTVRRNVNWFNFIIDLSTRFKDETRTNVVEKFNKLKQTGTMSLTLNFLRIYDL